MRHKLNFVFAVVLAFALALSFSPAAFAQFDVDWGTSKDTANSGFDDLGQWFFDNGYAASQADGAAFAQTGYAGYGAGDNDPFFFAPDHATFEVVQRIAGNASLTSFGYYTGTGLGKSLTEVLAAGENGPSASVNISNPFGIYINTPTSYLGTNYTNWFTDRAENTTQSGASTTNAGGDPQALIYKLNDSQWLLAWEDLDYTDPGNTDRDFNDAYLKVTVSPEPATMALFGLGGSALAAARLRRRKKS